MVQSQRELKGLKHDPPHSYENDSVRPHGEIRVQARHQSSQETNDGGREKKILLRKDMATRQSTREMLVREQIL